MFVKEAPAEHPEAALIEAAGLRWLDAAARSVGGVPVAQVHDVGAGRLRLEQIEQTAPDEAAAREFGVRLARTHRSLAHDPDLRFGGLPEEYPAGQPPMFGPADQPIAMGDQTHRSWGAFHATQRLDPLLSLLHQQGTGDSAVIRQARDRIASGAFDDDEPPALIHGDLWAGNVLWRRVPQEPAPASASASAGPASAAPVEAVLIDPAAHLGHRETDIGFLHLFGLPGLDAAMEGYQSQAPLREGWQQRLPLHQLFCLTAHWALFGTAYRAATLTAAERVVSL
ncbi:fructosamine kinase family protein [Nesterenkonia aerolata]|uniref:Fructosamine kinase family protein n=1 Tax=Nesterenkonia aerolata TaxID=3074079 RepID=A0ABU2DUD5_9MICC|nr:fructosamine kinase family protein [Nesterenkonia sp. LY-0111]MDR8019900.1 fructosamine kinase family protein [Nesterenkonia sp. LY-0111]